MEQLQIQQSYLPQVFENEQFGRVRGLDIDGEPWFVGKDVAVALGYSNPQRAIRNHVDDDDKGVTEMVTPGGKQQIPIINESGLYSLIISSELPGAKQFKRWITHDVIPTIRKHEMYITPQMAEKILADPDIMIRILQELKAERNKNAALEEENSLLAKEVLVHNPRDLVTRIIRKVGGVGMHNNFKYAWNLWKKDMYSLKGISLNRRIHDGSMLDAVREDEWQDAISVAVALARDFGVDISDEMRRTDWIPEETA